jgi:succinate dehydrogenase / fumarate reductase, cytochrome b subunit
MKSIGDLLQSTILQKWTMALTGLGLVLFLIGHVSGNLLIFVGWDAFNAYAAGLRELLHGAGIWVARIGLVVMFSLHIVTAYKLAARNRAARPQKYTKVEPRLSTLASRTMLWSGTLLLVYLLYHLAHFTWGVVHSEYHHAVDALGRHDAYSMVVRSFQQPIITIAYVAAMIFTAFHLNHAIASAFQTLGVQNPRIKPVVKRVGILLSVGLAISFSSVPLAVIAGVVKLP